MNPSSLDLPGARSRLLDFFPPTEDVSAFLGPREDKPHLTDPEENFAAEDFAPRWWPAPEANLP